MRRCSLLVTLVVAASCGGDNHRTADAAIADTLSTEALFDTPIDGGLTGAVEVMCRALPASQNTCDVTPGGATTLLLAGDVLTPTTIYRGGQVAIDTATGQIT